MIPAFKHGDKSNPTNYWPKAKTVPELSVKLQIAVAECSAWFDKWFLSLNDKKSEFLVIRSRNIKPLTLSLCLKGIVIPQVTVNKHLGVLFNQFLSWSDHAYFVSASACQNIGLLRC